MAKGLEETLLALLADPAAVAAQADIAQAAALARQELGFRQRAGAAAFQLRRAKAEGADPAEIAALEATLSHRTARLEAARVQAAAADFRRPFPDARQAQVFGRAQGTVGKPPLTAAALNADGKVAASAVADVSGSFHLTAAGDLADVCIQLSDAAGGVLWRSAGMVTVPAGSVLYLDAALGEPEPEPGPIPVKLRMPDLVGQSEGVARALLSRLGLEEVKVIDEVAEGQPGIVIAQDPRANAALPKGAKVTLTVRRAAEDAPEPRFLPGFVGRPVAEAEAVLKSLALRAAIKRQPDDGPQGIVLAQSPAEGTLLQDLRSVDLAVSEARAAPPETVKVPDLLGKPRDLALELLKATELQPEVTETADAAASAGVTAQDPAPGTPVARGSRVRITVNTPPAQDTGRVVVPQLVGGSAARAEKLLSTLGLKAEMAAQNSDAPEGEVVQQDPAADARVAVGASVKVAVSTGKPPARPGMKALIAAMAEDPRAAEAGFTPDRLEGHFRTADITTLDAARELADATPRDIRARLSLETAAEATTFRAVLRAAVKALG